METTESKTLSEKIVAGIKDTLIEIEELRVQAALGKMEARDLYEDSKKKFNVYVQEAKLKFEEAKNTASDEALRIKGIFEALQVQLALGKAETKEVFEEQRKKINDTLNQLEESIKSNKTANEYYAALLMEIKKFRIKLDILKLRFDLKAISAKQEFEDKKQDFLKELNSIKDRLHIGETENKWEHFQSEISKAYDHMRKAFTN